MKIGDGKEYQEEIYKRCPRSIYKAYVDWKVRHYYYGTDAAMRSQPSLIQEYVLSVAMGYKSCPNKQNRIEIIKIICQSCYDSMMEHGSFTKKWRAEFAKTETDEKKPRLEEQQAVDEKYKQLLHEYMSKQLRRMGIFDRPATTSQALVEAGIQTGMCTDETEQEQADPPPPYSLEQSHSLAEDGSTPHIGISKN